MSDYVAIDRADNQAMAELLKQRLEEAGIPCAVISGTTSSVSGFGASYEVRVPADRVDEAKALLGN